MTQENVAGTLGTSSVTVHRWESGKSPVTVQNYMRLAQIYGAEDIAMLTLPPADQEKARALREAWQIIKGLADDARADWIAVGRVLRATKPSSR